MVLFKECLRKGILPILIRDSEKDKYYFSLNKAQKENAYEALIEYFRKEQEYYYEIIKRFLWEYKRMIPGEVEENMSEACRTDFLTLGEE